MTYLYIIICTVFHEACRQLIGTPSSLSKPNIYSYLPCVFLWDIFVNYVSWVKVLSRLSFCGGELQVERPVPRTTKVSFVFVSEVTLGNHLRMEAGFQWSQPCD